MDYKNAYHYMFNCISILASSLEHSKESEEVIDVAKYLTQLLGECEELRVNSSADTFYKASRCGGSNMEHHSNV